MIRIGFSRWFIFVEEKFLNNNQRKFTLKLVPQANTFKVTYYKWEGLKKSEQEKSVVTKEFSTSLTYENYGLKMVRVLEELNKCAKSLASDCVKFCLHNDIIDFEASEQSALIFIVYSALVKAIQAGTKDEIVIIPEISFIDDIRTMREERQRRVAEQQEILRLQRAAHFEQAERIREQHQKKSAAATTKSFEFLNIILNEKERADWQNHKCVKVDTLLGSMYIPTGHHSMVLRYEDGIYKESLCVVFEDYSLPLGDEVAMKVALIKTDLKRFMKLANKFHWKPHGFKPF